MGTDTIRDAMNRRRQAIRAGFDARTGDWRALHTVLHGYAGGWFPHYEAEALWCPHRSDSEAVHGRIAIAWALLRMDAPANDRGPASAPTWGGLG